jgi:hypothetical protein
MELIHNDESLLEEVVVERQVGESSDEDVLAGLEVSTLFLHLGVLQPTLVSIGLVTDDDLIESPGVIELR